MYSISGGYYPSNTVSSRASIVLVCFLLALAATITLFICVLPAKKDGKLGNKFLQMLHDIFNFKSLLLEVILKALYVFLTIYLIFVGFFMLFNQGITGLLVMVIGPVVVRLCFEGIMMFIILVKKVISIDNKMKAEENDNNQNNPFHTAPAAPVEPAVSAAPEDMDSPQIVGYDPYTGEPIYSQNP